MSVELKVLREKQANLVSEARARMAEITPATDETRAAELERQHDAAMAEYDTLEARGQRLQKLAAAEASLNDGDPRRPGGEERSVGGLPPVTLDEKAVFRRAAQFGVGSLSADEQRMMSRLQAGDGPPEVRAQSTSATAGGYTIPQGFMPEITKSLALWGPMLDPGHARIIATDSGNPLPWPTVNDTANTGESLAENTAAADQDVTFGQKLLGAYVFDSGTIKVSLQLLQDSAFDMETLLGDLFGERLARRANSQLTIGTGSSQPLGVVTGSTLGKTAASTTAIAADEMIDLFHSVDPAYRQAPKACWMMNDTTLAAVRKLKDGQGNYLWQMGNIREGAPDLLLGKPVAINQAMASIATGNRVVAFGDMNKYIVRMVKDFSMLTLRERYAEFLQVGFLAYLRLDGMLADTSAIKHYKLA